MSRIRKGYEDRFRALLLRARARRLDQGVQWLVVRAHRLSAHENIPLPDALARVYEQLAAHKPLSPSDPPPAPIQFFCDSGLGGLARWLRAAGYEASWQPHIADDALLRQARALSATLLTTDSMLMERRLLRDRVIPAFWLPPTLATPEQLALVVREFCLTLRPPRCMTCGGDLCPVPDKHALRERIPPRTYRWLDQFFICRRCDRLFWHGTHWQRIAQTLATLPRQHPRA